MRPQVDSFFDPATFSFTHLVSCPNSNEAVIIDPVLDFDPAAMSTATSAAQRLLDVIDERKLTLRWVLETHAHADHLSASHWLREQRNVPIVIGAAITQVQSTFNALFELEGDSAASAADFDCLALDGEKLPLGNGSIEVMHTPGHTPSCCTYLIGDAAFVGDTLFMPDFGTARCDFPGGDAATLYRSIRRILALPEQTRLFMCHDYQPGGRELAWQCSVAEQRAQNIHIHDGVDEAAYVTMRTQRDAQLAVPRLILPALQVNIRAGKLPRASASGTHFLRLPLNKLGAR